MEIWIRVLMSVNVFLFRLTGGRLGSRMSGQDVLLLQTVGRKSGVERTIPVNYFRDGSNYVLVASNWGKPHHPAWYLNLLKQPSATIQVRERKLRVTARPAGEADYDRLWRDVTGKNPFYLRYQQQTARKIPLVILEEVTS
jgi:deazaflavin-dependent oxidoreductase (nitroreductase family)